MADDVLDRVEKQIEGTNLALAAVAEVLQKMDYRLSKEEEEEEREVEENAEATQKSDLVKAVATEVVSMLKADQGMDVDGAKTRSASKSKGGAADQETAVTINSDIKNQQATIQAMIKELEGKDDDEDEDSMAKEGSASEVNGAEDDEDKKEAMYKEGNGEDDDEDEYPSKEASSMEKQLNELKKQVAEYEANMQKSVQTEAENRLRKMGFREETSLQRPKIIQKDAEIGLGVDGSTPIKKSSETVADTVEQLMDMSYQELRNLQYRIEAGETDGLPRELIDRS